MDAKKEKKRKILELRERLDKTLASPELANGESIESLVKDQLLRSSFSGNEGELGNVIARRTKEVSNFLEMLRSASGNETEASHRDWKIKQDSEQLRVMYCEGPHGTPFHTLLAEGYADGPTDVCLCVSWESTLYKKWWPQYNIPTFKIITSTCLQKVRIGEEISLVRMKVPWPISDREALLHYFEIEYFKEDLILVLINSISDSEHIDVNTHGFSRDGIPEATDTVRIDLVGGFVSQKVSAHRSYFRAISNVDVKLDFMPPSLINFVSRQLIGNGHKLYQKAVGSVAASDEEYRKALKGPMYVRIREGLDSSNKHKQETASVGLEEEKHIGILTAEHTVETSAVNKLAMHNTVVTEIVEEEVEQVPHLGGYPPMNGTLTDAMTNQEHVIKDRAFISPEVEHALGILERAIAMVHGGVFYKTRSDCSSVDHEFLTSETVVDAGSPNDGAPKNSNMDKRSNESRGDQEFLTSETVVDAGSPNDGAPKNSNMDKRSNESKGQSPAENFRYNGVVTMSGKPQENSSLPTERRILVSGKTQETNVNPSSHGKLIGATVTPKQPTLLDSVKVCDERSLKANGFHGSGPYRGRNKPNRKKNLRLCCLNLSCIRG